MHELVYILASVILISLISLVGVVSLALGHSRLKEILGVFVAFASGALLSASFLHMMPEASHEIGERVFPCVLAGILFFFFIEKFIHWHHCGKEECKVHPVAHLNLIGDGLHNFIDGVIIAAAYMVSTSVGMLTTFAIALHEIPQEFGDFSILLHSGMSSRKALFCNFLSATTAILGALAGYLFLSRIQEYIPYSIAIASGGFVYIATADLIPELHRQKNKKKLVIQTISLIFGVVLLALSLYIMPHSH